MTIPQSDYSTEWWVKGAVVLPPPDPDPEATSYFESDHLQQADWTKAPFRMDVLSKGMRKPRGRHRK